MFLILLSVYLSIHAASGKLTKDSEFSTTLEDISDSCEMNARSTANLDLAVMLLQNVRHSYPVCSLPVDCEDAFRNGQRESGVYKVFPRSRVVQNPIEVYCDMDTDGGGWTVIQRRGDFLRPIDSFFQDWQTYKKGFGNIEEDFWLGNDNIFGLSNQRLYSVRFDLQDVEGNQSYALYDTFWIDDENHKYTLHINGYSGDAGDSMSWHNGYKFSTKDQQNDNQPEGHNSCAQRYKGAWWYNRCHVSNLNGLYLRGKHQSFADGVNWRTWRGYHESLEQTEIKIRRKDFRR